MQSLNADKIKEMQLLKNLPPIYLFFKKSHAPALPELLRKITPPASGEWATKALVLAVGVPT